jgi:hypothetical protein
MTGEVEPDAVLRISIMPSQDGRFQVTTAYQGWRFAEVTDATRTDLSALVLAHLNRVLTETEDGEVRVMLDQPGTQI